MNAGAADAAGRAPRWAALLAAAVGLGVLAVDHLVGTEPGADEGGFADPGAFAVTAGILLALTLLLWGRIVRRAERRQGAPLAAAFGCGGFAVATLPIVFAGAPFAFAGAGLGLGLLVRERGRPLVGAAAAGLSVAVLAVAAVAYAAALVTR